MAGTIKKYAGICIGLILFAVGTAGCVAGEHNDQKQAEKTYEPDKNKKRVRTRFLLVHIVISFVI